MPRTLRRMRPQKKGGREIVQLARGRLGGRYTRTIGRVDQELMGARQTDRYKVCTQRH